jgi:hypothetical protein
MAKLANIEAAVVEDAKLDGYLLNPAHPRGAAKARFLESFGFTRSDLAVLRDALTAHATANDVASARQSNHGIRYEIDGPLLTPNGRAPVVRVVGFVRASEDFPRLVTLIPRKVRRP